MLNESLGAAIFNIMVHTAEKGDKHICSQCGSSHVDVYEYKKKKYQACLDCGEEKEIKE